MSTSRQSHLRAPGPGRKWYLLPLALAAALLLCPGLSSEASARRAALRNRVAKKSATQMHVSPKQRKVRMQRKQARVKRVWRTPTSRASSRFASRRRSVVTARRGPLRARKQRTRFSQRRQRKSRTVDRFGRWTRHDKYSIR